MSYRGRNNFFFYLKCSTLVCLLSESRSRKTNRGEPSQVNLLHQKLPTLFLPGNKPGLRSDWRKHLKDPTGVREMSHGCQRLFYGFHEVGHQWHRLKPVLLKIHISSYHPSESSTESPTEAPGNNRGFNLSLFSFGGSFLSRTQRGFGRDENGRTHDARIRTNTTETMIIDRDFCQG